MDKIELLHENINRHSRIVFFGGAGVSTESGIPDFRSVDGIYNQKYRYSPERILSHEFFYDNQEEFFRFYKDKMICLDAQPNHAHRILAELEKAEKLSAVITQNIDGLHQMAGSENVVELHGSIHRNYCIKCRRAYSAEYILTGEGVPHCECGKVIKPDVVLYGEGLDGDVMSKAIGSISNADMLIVGGTSLAVYPAAGFLDYFNGGCLAVINRSVTPIDSKADIVINDSIGAVLSKAVKGKDC